MPELPWASKRSLHFLTKLGDRAVYSKNKKLTQQGHLLAGVTLLPAYTVEPPYYEPLYNEVLVIAINLTQ